MKPKLLDLFCGAGGASMGYHRAGFEVVGVDNKPQPHYPFPFLLMDALEAMDRLLRREGLTFSNDETLYLNDFAAFHASPPCQRYSVMTKRWGRSEDHPDLIATVRQSLELAGYPFVIENVEGAPLLNPVKLCGSMFRLGAIENKYQLRRHRLFETSWGFLFAPSSCCHQGLALPVYGHAGGQSKRDGLIFPGTEAWREGMDINWMTGKELAEAIPPAYAEYIGKGLMRYVSTEGL